MPKPNSKNYSKIAICLAIVFAVWFALDRFTKIYFDANFSLGEKITDSIFGIFHLTLVHNTGAAFGIFATATIALAIVSAFVSLVLLAMPFINQRLMDVGKSTYQLKTLHLICLGVVAAGGIGNAIDRFFTGYVVDFICFDFIDFPVFNIADIGVTCGILLLVILMLVDLRRA